MAPRKRPTRPAGAPAAGGPRRLGDQTTPTRAPSAGAARRAARSRQNRSRSLGWIAVGVVVIVVVALLVVKLTSNNKPASTTGDAAGRNPAGASALVVFPITHISTSVFDAIGTDKEAAPLQRTPAKTLLTSAGLPRVVYFGAEYCPYCAVMRWSLIAALSRFGTFSNLKQISSANDDGNIPTFSFLGATYASKYVVFSPYEYEDRNQNPLQTVPTDVTKLVTTYDYPPYQTTQTQGGIPFIDVANQFVQGGDSTALGDLVSNGVLTNGGPGRQAIANAIADPTSSVGQAISAKFFVSQANYLSGAICLTNGAQPKAVCGSSGVKAAMTNLAALKAK